MDHVNVASSQLTLLYWSQYESMLKAKIKNAGYNP